MVLRVCDSLYPSSNHSSGPFKRLLSIAHQLFLSHKMAPAMSRPVAPGTTSDTGVGAAEPSPQLQSGQLRDWETFAKALQKHFKNNGRRFLDAMHAESRILERLVAENTEDVRCVRAWETAEIDGAFILAPDTVTNIPKVDTSMLDMIAWARSTKEVRFLTFDVKSVAFRPVNANIHARGGLHQLAYRWTEHKVDEVADIILVEYEGVEDYIGVLPKDVWNQVVEYGYGIEPLIAKVPYWSQIFMVHRTDLHEALRRVLRAARDGLPYVNPTLKIEFDLWRPAALSTGSCLLTQNKAANTAMDAILRFKKAIDKIEGAKLIENPLQPLVCDFLLRLPHLAGLLFVEHKCCTIRPGRPMTLRDTGKSSPFAPARMWHFVVFEDLSRDSFICIPRHRVGDEWYSRSQLDWDDVSEFHVSGRDSMPSIVQKMLDAAEPAFQASRAAVQYHSDDGCEALVSSSAIKSLKKVAAARMTPYKRPEKVYGSSHKGVEFYLKGLPWLSPDLNRWCSHYRYGLVFTLPPGHIDGTHVFVAYDWSDEDGTFADGLPRQIFSKEILENRCLILHMCDMSTGWSSQHSPAWPLHMRRGYWLRPGTSQKFFYIGSMMDSSFMEADDTRKPYWLFPSDATTHQKEGFRAQNTDKPSHFFRKEALDQHALKDLKHHSRPSPLLPGSTFIKAESGVNPGRWMAADDEALFLHLRSILKGGPGQEHHINSPQSLSANRALDCSSFHALLRSVLKRTWDFGGKHS